MTTTPPAKNTRSQALVGTVLAAVGAALLVLGIALFLGPGSGFLPALVGVALLIGGIIVRSTATAQR